MVIVIEVILIALLGSDEFVVRDYADQCLDLIKPDDRLIWHKYKDLEIDSRVSKYRGRLYWLCGKWVGTNSVWIIKSNHELNYISDKVDWTYIYNYEPKSSLLSLARYDTGFPEYYIITNPVDCIMHYELKKGDKVINLYQVVKP